MNVKNWLKKEFVNGQTKFDWTFMITGILIQILAIVYTVFNPDGMSGSQVFWTSVSGITGIVSVVLCAQGKISFYVFGYIQLFSYVFAVAIPERLWGELWENVFYFVTMLIGMVIWIKNYKCNDDGAKVESKKLSKHGIVLSVFVLIVSTIILALVLKGTSDPLPWFDSITTTAPFIAQIFLMLGYRDQWAYWIIEDILSFVMFVILGNWIMVAQYLFWTVNCVYGWYKWSKNATTRNE